MHVSNNNLNHYNKGNENQASIFVDAQQLKQNEQEPVIDVQPNTFLIERCFDSFNEKQFEMYDLTPMKRNENDRDNFLDFGAACLVIDDKMDNK